MMYCETCEAFFEEAEARVRLIPEQYEAWGKCITHEYVERRCPYCGNEEIEEALEGGNEW